jgi:signal transduction histidine kinase
MGDYQKWFRVNLVVFIFAWIIFGGYTFISIFKPDLEYSVRIFWTFLLILDVLAAPLLWLWYKAYPQTVRNSTHIGIAAVIFVFFYGFATIHSFISLQLNNLQVRWLGFVYIWEVVVVGALVAYCVGLTTKFADDFLQRKKNADDPTKIHEKLAFTPLKASFVYIGIVLFGYGIGSAQLYIFSKLPLLETFKNFTNGVVASILSSFAVYFLMERVLAQALKKSGSQSAALEISGSRPRRHTSLFIKIYGITGLLALMSVGFFTTVALGRTQAVLEDGLIRRMRDVVDLTHIQRQSYEGGELVFEEQKRFLGEQGKFHLLARTSLNENYSIPEDILTLLPDESTSISLDHETIFYNRDRQVKIIGFFPMDDFHMAAVAVFGQDFSEGLQLLIGYNIGLFFMIVAAVAIIGTLFAHSITVPIREIKEGGIRMGKGIFSQPITVYTNDELEDLSVALNQAGQELQHSYEHLEEEVKQRTQEIEKINKEQQEQIRRLDETSRRLVRRDFELQMANQKLREIDESKSQFVSIAAHQLRTPLSAIKWTFSMLMSSDFGDMTLAQETAIRRASDSVDRIIALVGDLLNVARIESGQIIYKFVPFQIDKLIETVLQDVSPKAMQKHITITVGKPRKKLPEIRGDVERLELVIQNLVENAVNYTSEGGSIKIQYKQSDEQHYEVSISDTGIGIPKQQMPLLFQKFFRGDNVVKLQKPGTGLGLYAASRIVEAHGGTIQVQSEEGKGSTFSVRLPFLT